MEAMAHNPKIIRNQGRRELRSDLRTSQACIQALLGHVLQCRGNASFPKASLEVPPHLNQRMGPSAPLDAGGADEAPEANYEALPNLDGDGVKRLSGPGIRIFLRIAQAWQLSPEQKCQLLGDISESMLHQWICAQDATLSIDQLERISHVLGIYKSLQILLPSSADGWVKRPNTNTLFKGQPAIQLMTLGGISGLRQVRFYLDGLRH